MNDEEREFLHWASGVQMARIWRAKQEGKVLAGEEALIARVMDEHPDWHEIFARADELPEDFVTAEGVNPLAAVFVDAAAEAMIGHDGDPVAREAYQALRAGGHAHQGARRIVGKVFTGVMWALGANRLAEERATPFFHEALRRVGAGEDPGEIFKSFYG